jgi:hypothetical protein
MMGTFLKSFDIEYSSYIAMGGLSRDHAVGQASRLSLTLNDLLEALLFNRDWHHRIVRDNLLMETGATPVLQCDRTRPSGFNCMVPADSLFDDCSVGHPWLT